MWGVAWDGWCEWCEERHTAHHSRNTCACSVGTLEGARHPYLRVKGGVFDEAVDKDPQVVFDHKGLDVGLLVLLVDLLRQRSAGRCVVVVALFTFYSTLLHSAQVRLKLVKRAYLAIWSVM